MPTLSAGIAREHATTATAAGWTDAATGLEIEPVYFFGPPGWYDTGDFAGTLPAPHPT